MAKGLGRVGQACLLELDWGGLSIRLGTVGVGGARWGSSLVSRSGPEWLEAGLEWDVNKSRRGREWKGAACLQDRQETERPGAASHHELGRLGWVCHMARGGRERCGLRSARLVGLMWEWKGMARLVQWRELMRSGLEWHVGGIGWACSG